MNVLFFQILAKYMIRNPRTVNNKQSYGGAPLYTKWPGVREWGVGSGVVRA